MMLVFLRMPRRIAFTLIELLVVIAIIGVMVGMLLPAVQNARESARRTQCSNRTRQMGLAIHNYHDAFRKLPPALWLELAPKQFNGKSWAISILPFIEQQSLFEKFNHSLLSVDQLSPANVALIQTPLADYVCPSSPGNPEQRRYTFNATSAGLPFTANNVAPCDFIVTSGVRGLFSQHAYQGNPPPARDGVLKSLWVFSTDKDSTFAGILDGLSNTTLLGERTGGPIIYSAGREHPVATTSMIALNGGGWGDILNGEMWLEGTLQGGLTWPPQGGPCAINCTNAKNYGFYSFHQGGAHFLMADAAVRFVNQSVDARVFACAVTRQGREASEGMQN